MIDKILAAISMAGLIVFLWVVVDRVREPDLTLVIAIPIGIAIYAVWKSLRGKANDNGSTAES